MKRKVYEKKKMSYLRKEFFTVIMGVLFAGAVAFADGSAAVVETYTGESQISVYVKGIEADAHNTSVQIATAAVDQYDMKPLSALDVPMQTLVMVDNSVSISEDNRKKVGQLLQDLIADRINQEELCIATFSEELHVIADYTSDYTTLRHAIDSIAYEDQETYLTDVLYEVLKEQFAQPEDDVYQRIVIISDGVDNKSLGYTKDELYSLLKEVAIPVYTIGSVGKNNNEELENMFALSRMTSAEAFLLDETEDVLSISEALRQDCDIVRLVITPPESLMDGSVKTVKITFADSQTLSAEITMPQVVVDAETDDALVHETEKLEPSLYQEESGTVEQTESVPQSTQHRRHGNMPFILGIVLLIMAAGVGVIIFLIKRKRTKDDKDEIKPFDDGQILNPWGTETEDEGQLTEMLGSAGDNGETLLILPTTAAYQVSLTDIHIAGRTYTAPLNRVVVVGRKAESCDIVLDYDKSVSGQHCEISVRDDKFYIKDLQSSNYTYLNGEKVATEAEVFSGNVIKLGRLEMRIEIKRV